MIAGLYRRGLVVPLMAAALVVSGPGQQASFAAPARTPAPAGPRTLQAQTVPSVHGQPVVPRTRPAQLTHGATNPAPVRVTWPAAGGADVPVRTGAATRAGALPVWVTGAIRPAAASTPSADGLTGRVHVDLLDRATVPDGWRNGPVLRVARTDGVTSTGNVLLGVDYSGFVGAYGADYASRLKLVALPDCALSTVEPVGCRATPLPSTNDSTAMQVTADVTVSAAATTVALVAGASGDSGSFAATSLSASSNWSVGGNSGNFSWQYAMDTPPGLGGPEPDVSLDYSSSSVDGRNATTNNQPGWAGEGFDYTPGFIERAYKPCADDEGSGANNTTDTGDECWGIDNAVLSLSGHSGELIKDDAGGGWHLKDDDNTKIEHLTDTVNADNDHEYWRLTTDDGTQYYFGRNRLPGYTGTAPADKTTNSVWTLPVAGNNANEPCHATSFTGSFCAQAWRWNLDYEVDPRGNTMSYFYDSESNNYARNFSDTDVQSYVRGGYVDHVDYGTDQRSGTDTEETSTAAPMRVSFGVDDRCLSGCATHDVAHWPDTPWDQSCTSSSTCKGLYSPTFWLTKRLSTVTTKVWDAGTSGYKNVDLWTLTHTFPPSGDDTRDGLWLASVTHTGEATGPAVVGTAKVLPSVSFDWTQMHNRVDTTTDGEPAMNWMRLSTIWTDTGGKIDVRYLPQQCVAGTTMPTSPQSNTLRCYPVLVRQPDKSTKTEYFNKYPVQSVTEADWTGGGLDVTSTYTYVGGPAWRHADDDGMTRDNLRTWSEYRGYAQVNTQVGIVGGGQQTLKESTYFQGMNGDLNGSGGTRSVSLPAIDVNGDGSTTGPADAPAVPDEDAYAGMARATTEYNGVESAPVSTSVDHPWQSAATATRDMGDTTVYARHTGTAASWDGTKLAAGGWRVSRTGTTFDGYGLPTKVDDQGDVAVTGDERCTTTAYATNTAANLIDLTAEVDEYALRCSQAPATDADVISMTRTLYDSHTFTQTPSRGEETETDTAKAWSGGSPTWLTQTTTGYDAYGRTNDVTDVRGNHTTTVYTPASGGPVTQTAITSTQGTATTTVEPSWGSATAVVDENGKRTDVTYDAVGRTSQVWQPNHLKASYPSQPNASYDYLVRNSGGVNAVTTSRLNAAGGYTTGIALFDGLLRARQTQTVSLANGHVGTVFGDTEYDSAGRVAQVSQHFDSTVQPSTTLFAIADWQPRTQTVTQYDRVGRTTAEIVNSVGIEQWRTTTSYGGDRVTVVPPAGGTPTTTLTDALDRTTAVREYHSAADAGSDTRTLFDQVTYHYNRKGQRDSWTDNAGNTWTAAFDLIGNQTSGHDPDAGDSSSTFDDAGDLLTTTDSRNQTLAYAYDALGRKTGEYQGSTSGPKLATWDWDPVGAVGQLASSSRFVGTDEYKTTVNGYTPMYQSTGETYTIPGSQTGLGGSYTFSRTYKVDGSPATMSYPSGGGLGAETLTYSYDSTDGLPEQLQTNSPGRGQYVANTDYTAYGELSLVSLQTTGGSFLQRGLTYDDATHRLKEALTIRQTVPQAVDDTTYGYDATGNVTKISDTAAGAGTDNQCFGYDYARRLAAAWTPTSGDCTQAASATALGGPAPYWQSWTFDPAGNRKTQTDHAAGGDTVATSTYPASGAASVRPHAVSSVSTTGPAGATTASYGYDALGDTTARPGPAAAQTLSWDTEGTLGKVTENSKDTTYIYDADGDRLVQAAPGSTTLYLPGEDLVRDNATNVVSGTRYYTWSGGTGGQFNSSTGKLTWLLSDQQGTQTTEVDSGSQSVTARRETPYGAARGTSTAWLNTRGFVNGVNDATGLIHEGAREYDPTLGAFASADPLVDEQNPLQLQGYNYAGYSPVTNSDPTGQMYAMDGGGGGGSSSSGCGSANACEEEQRQAAAKKKKKSTGSHHTSSGCGSANACEEEQRQAKRNSGRSHHSASECWSANACEERQRLAKKSTGSSHRSSSECWSANACEERQRLAPHHAVTVAATLPAPAAKPRKPAWYCHIFSCEHHGTGGLCASAAIGWGAYYSAQGCIAWDHHGLFFTYTDAVANAHHKSLGVGGGVGAGVQMSDGTNKNSLAGPFKYGSGGAGPVSGGFAWGPDGQRPGHTVHVTDVGGGAGSPVSGAGGMSNTDVSGYLGHWCWHILCDVGHDTN